MPAKTVAKPANAKRFAHKIAAKDSRHPKPRRRYGAAEVGDAADAALSNAVSYAAARTGALRA